MSKFNSDTSFLYQLFKENSNFIVKKPCKVIYLSAYDVFVFYIYLYINIYTPSNQHFKAFPVSKFNSKTSFLYQLFKENSNFIVKTHARLFVCLLMMSLFFILLRDKVIYLSMFYDCHYYLYSFICNYLCIYIYIYMYIYNTFKLTF